MIDNSQKAFYLTTQQHNASKPKHFYRIIVHSKFLNTTVSGLHARDATVYLLYRWTKEKMKNPAICIKNPYQKLIHHPRDFFEKQRPINYGDGDDDVIYINNSQQTFCQLFQTVISHQILKSGEFVLMIDWLISYKVNNVG